MWASALTGGALQAAGEMPSRDRTLYIRRRLRFEYDQARAETRPERIECVQQLWGVGLTALWIGAHLLCLHRFLLRLAETQLETVQVQAQHLAATFSSPDYHRE